MMYAAFAVIHITIVSGPSIASAKAVSVMPVVASLATAGNTCVMTVVGVVRSYAVTPKWVIGK